MVKQTFTYLTGVITFSFFVIAAHEAWQRDWTGVFVVSQAILVSFLPYLLRRWFDIYTPLAFRVGIVLFMGSTLVLGEIADFYNMFWWWDLVLHSVSSAGLTIIGFITLLIFFKSRELRAWPLFTSFIAFSISMSAAVLWEIYEFLIDFYFQTDSPMQPSNTDTMTDLIVAVAGALIVAFFGYRYLRFRDGGVLGEIIQETAMRNK